MKTRQSMILILAAIILSSCSPSIDKSKLVGNWDTIEFEAELTETDKKLYGMTEEMMAMGKAMALEADFHFSDDGILLVKHNDGSTDKSKWFWSDRSPYLSVNTSIEGFIMNTTYKVEVLNDSILTIQTNDPDGKNRRSLRRIEQ